MSQNKYHIRIARDETRSMSRYERLWYQGTARWFLLFGLFILAGVSVFLVVASIRAKPQTQVAGSRIVAPVTERNFPHFYLVVNTGNIELLPSAKNVWESAKSGAILRDGDAIRTKADSYATLLSNSDTVVRVAPNSEVQLLSIADPSAKYSTVNIRINSGSLWLTMSRVAGQKTHAMVITPHGFFVADEGIFSVTAASHDVASVLAGSAKVSVLASANTQSDDIIQNAQTHATTLTPGQQATMQPEKPSALIAVESISNSTKNSYWFRWNSDLDAQYQSSLLNTFDKDAPPLNIDESSEHLVAHTAPFVVIRGTTSLDAHVFVNSVETQNVGGNFSYTYSFPNGNGPHRVGLRVIAMNRFGEQASKDIVVEFQPDSSTTHVVVAGGVALALSSKSTSGGVLLTWTGVGNDKKLALVRSETDDNISYTGKNAYKEFPSNASQYVDTSVLDAHSYSYRVCTVSVRPDCSNVVSVVHDTSGYEPTLGVPTGVGVGTTLTWNGYVGSHFQKYVVVFARETGQAKLDVSDAVTTEILDASHATLSLSELSSALPKGEWFVRVALVRSGFPAVYTNEQSFEVQ